MVKHIKVQYIPQVNWYEVGVHNTRTIVDAYQRVIDACDKLLKDLEGLGL